MNPTLLRIAGLVLALSGCSSRPHAEQTPERSVTTVTESSEPTPVTSTASSPDEMNDSGIAGEHPSPLSSATPTPKAEAAPSAAPPEPTSHAPVEPAPVAKKKPARPTPPPAEAVKATRGQAADGEGFTAWLETTGGYRVGAPGAVVAVLNAKAPYHCNAEYPHKFKVESPAPNVKFASTTVTGMRTDAAPCTMPISFTPIAAGEVRIAGTLSFSVCDENRCLVERRALSVSGNAR